LAVNPSIIVLENAKEAINSQTFDVIESVLSNSGYNIQKIILDSAKFGSMESRKRTCFVAVSRGLEVDITHLTNVDNPTKLTVSDILEHVEDSDPSWSTMDYLLKKEVRDIEAGKGFKMHVVSGKDNKIATIGKSYQKNRSTETKVQHHDNPKLLRLFTKLEHARIKDFPAFMVDNLPKTTAHEVLGNGITKAPFFELAKSIGTQLLSLGMKIKPNILSEKINNIVNLEARCHPMQLELL